MRLLATLAIAVIASTDNEAPKVPKRSFLRPLGVALGIGAVAAGTLYVSPQARSAIANLEIPERISALNIPKVSEWVESNWVVPAALREESALKWEREEGEFLEAVESGGMTMAHHVTTVLRAHDTLLSKKFVRKLDSAVARIPANSGTAEFWEEILYCIASESELSNTQMCLSIVPLSLRLNAASLSEPYGQCFSSLFPVSLSERLVEYAPKMFTRKWTAANACDEKKFLSQFELLLNAADADDIPAAVDAATIIDYTHYRPSDWSLVFSDSRKRTDSEDWTTLFECLDQLMTSSERVELTKCWSPHTA